MRLIALLLLLTSSAFAFTNDFTDRVVWVAPAVQSNSPPQLDQILAINSPILLTNIEDPAGLITATNPSGGYCPNYIATLVVPTNRFTDLLITCEASADAGPFDITTNNQTLFQLLCNGQSTTRPDNVAPSNQTHVSWSLLVTNCNCIISPTVNVNVGATASNVVFTMWNLRVFGFPITQIGGGGTPLNPTNILSGYVIITLTNLPFGLYTNSIGGSTNALEIGTNNIYTTFGNTNAGTAGQVFTNAPRVDVSTNLSGIVNVQSNSLACFQERCPVPITSTNGWGFANTNSGTAIIFTNNTMEIIQQVTASSYMAMYTNAPASNYEAVVKMELEGGLGGDGEIGLILIDGNLATNSIFVLRTTGTGIELTGQPFANFTGTSLSIAGNQPYDDQVVWLRQMDDGVNATASVSSDGINWAVVFQSPKNNVWKTGATNQPAFVGIIWGQQDVSSSASNIFVNLSWQLLNCHGNCY